MSSRLMYIFWQQMEPGTNETTLPKCQALVISFIKPLDNRNLMTISSSGLFVFKMMLCYVMWCYEGWYGVTYCDIEFRLSFFLFFITCSSSSWITLFCFSYPVFPPLEFHSHTSHEMPYFSNFTLLLFMTYSSLLTFYASAFHNLLFWFPLEFLLFCSS